MGREDVRKFVLGGGNHLIGGLHNDGKYYVTNTGW